MLECGLAPAVGAVVILSGQNYPYDILTDTVPASGALVFSHIIKGEYGLTISYIGYETYTSTVTLQNNQSVDATLLQVLYKPDNLMVDGGSLIATWDAPLEYLLNEDFESGGIPGWQFLTQASTGWNITNNGSSPAFTVPPHTTYAVANDELGGAANNGCCDYLITPELNLTGSEGYKLSFRSYYTGANGQLATVEMSADFGISWTPIYTCAPSADWQQVDIDLSAYSGPTGLPAVNFAFHADDAGNQASGWAVDDVTIGAASLPVLSYKVYLDGTEVGETTAQTWTFDPATIIYGQTYQATVAAVYCTGISETDTADFTSSYLYPPQNLAVDTSITATTGGAILTWEAPLPSAASVVNYNIYRNDMIVVTVPATPLEYTDLNLAPGSYCYDITAVYDITAFGFPGATAESIKEGPECVDIVYGGDLPFFEDFSSGEFDTTLWNPGQNWLVDEDSDNPVPAAKFRWDPLMVDYSSALESNWINPTNITTSFPYEIWLDFELKLLDQSVSATEKLSIEVWNGTSWNTVKEYPNNGSFEWRPENINITLWAKDQPFKVRFRALGQSSGNIQYWAVDNVYIYAQIIMPAPMNLLTQLVTTNGNDVQLMWSSPEAGGTFLYYVLDDNTAEAGVSFNSPGEYWVGNEYPVTDAGVLKIATLYLEPGGSAVYSVDVFDADHNLAGSSAIFTPALGGWTEVALPDIPYDGTFYIMLHMVVSTESDILALDTNGPNAASDFEWFYDGAGWSKLSALGFEPCVVLIRATGFIEGKKAAVTYQAGSTNSGYLSPFAEALEQQSLTISTGGDVAHVVWMGDNTDSLIGYNVYRRAYTVFPAGQNTNTSGEWTKIAHVSQTEYLDTNLSNLVTNCYEYQVTMLYTEGESLPSNTDWECIFTDIKPNIDNKVNLYPNPATTFIRIDFVTDVSSISIYNSMGLLIEIKTVKGESTLVLNTSGFAPGAYGIKFTTRSGECFNRKFIVTN